MKVSHICFAWKIGTREAMFFFSDNLLGLAWDSRGRKAVEGRWLEFGLKIQILNLSLIRLEIDLPFYQLGLWQG